MFIAILLYSWRKKSLYVQEMALIHINIHTRYAFFTYKRQRPNHAPSPPINIIKTSTCIYPSLFSTAIALQYPTLPHLK